MSGCTVLAEKIHKRTQVDKQEAQITLPLNNTQSLYNVYIAVTRTPLTNSSTITFS